MKQSIFGKFILLLIIALPLLSPLAADYGSLLAFRGGEARGHEGGVGHQNINRGQAGHRAVNPEAARGVEANRDFKAGAAVGGGAYQNPGTQVIVTPPAQQPINPAPYPTAK
jgi:hypothetical protein